MDITAVIKAVTGATGITIIKAIMDTKETAVTEATMNTTYIIVLVAVMDTTGVKCHCGPFIYTVKSDPEYIVGS
jgi:hypothetical protein